MPSEEYEARTDSVLAWKKSQKLGRFDPNAPTIEQHKIRAIEREIEERGKLQFSITHAFVQPLFSYSARPRRQSLKEKKLRRSS
jgi:hypothetical protein